MVVTGLEIASDLFPDFKRFCKKHVLIYLAVCAALPLVLLYFKHFLSLLYITAFLQLFFYDQRL